MKSKKAVTLLTRIETLLSDVLDECSAIEKSVEKSVREALASAQASVVSARDYIMSVVPASEVGRGAAKSRKKAKPSTRARKRGAAPAAKRRAVKT